MVLSNKLLSGDVNLSNVVSSVCLPLNPHLMTTLKIFLKLNIKMSFPPVPDL